MAKKKKKGRKQRNRVKKAERIAIIRSGCDCHHLLYQRRFWNTRHARALREHPYFKIMIPIATLHSEIHREIWLIPVPGEKTCFYAYRSLVNQLELGYLSMDDPPYQRLDFLIRIWREDSPETTEVLKKEREIIFNYYNKI